MNYWFLNIDSLYISILVNTRYPFPIMLINLSINTWCFANFDEKELSALNFYCPGYISHPKFWNLLTLWDNVEDILWPMQETVKTSTN